MEPSRSLENYKRELYPRTGSYVSKTTINDLFLHGSQYWGSMQKTSKVTIDKYKQENIIRTKEYVLEITAFRASRVKFGDKKCLKGSFSIESPPNHVTGEVEPIMVDLDFRNAYTIVAFCGIDRRATAFDYIIHSGTNDSSTFCFAIDTAISKGFLRYGDILVLDNAAIHHYQDSDDLEESLWDNFRILLIFLPTRSPELNPIKLLWRTLVARLKTSNINGHRPRAHASALAAMQIIRWCVRGLQEERLPCRLNSS